MYFFSRFLCYVPFCFYSVIRFCCMSTVVLLPSSFISLSRILQYLMMCFGIIAVLNGGGSSIYGLCWLMSSSWFTTREHSCLCAACKKNQIGSGWVTERTSHFFFFWQSICLHNFCSEILLPLCKSVEVLCHAVATSILVLQEAHSVNTETLR
jgi:hypothetical protein